MELSLFIAKLLGLYLLIISALMVLRKQEFETTIHDLFSSNALLYFAGALNLLIGLAIAIGHPIWEWNWRGLITLLGYLSILKGIIRIGHPHLARTFEPKFMRGNGYWVVWAVAVILGVFLTYHGFMV